MEFPSPLTLDEILGDCCLTPCMELQNVHSTIPSPTVTREPVPKHSYSTWFPPLSEVIALNLTDDNVTLCMVRGQWYYAREKIWLPCNFPRNKIVLGFYCRNKKTGNVYLFDIDLDELPYERYKTLLKFFQFPCGSLQLIWTGYYDSLINLWQRDEMMQKEVNRLLILTDDFSVQKQKLLLDVKTPEIEFVPVS